MTHTPTSQQEPADHPPATRFRAAAMPAEERRRVIISATLPLVRQHGASVTTSQIAQAAGIAEGTIFRVFPDKRQLLLAALHSAMSADAEVAQIAAIPSEAPLTDRLVAALAAISAYQERLWSLMRALQDLGWRPGHDELDQDDGGPHRQLRRIATAVAGLLPCGAGSLRLEPLPAARLLIAMSFSSRMERGTGEPSATPEQLVDIFLHGALRAHEEIATETEPERLD